VIPIRGATVVCALTVRKLKPGTFEEFREAFMRFNDPDDPPAGWVRFNMVRNSENPDEVVCFGFFDGDVDQLRASALDLGYQDQQNAIAPFIESVGTDGLYEIVEDYSVARA
jgi:heme-degrading monooxygenase HmoA